MTTTPQQEREAWRQYFWDRTEVSGENECWRWLGSVTRYGYGIARVSRQTVVATRLSLVLHGKKRPSDKHFACHTCDNPICVNPAHLWWGTHRENMQDAVRKGRLKSDHLRPWHGHNSSKTKCIAGHPYTPDNTLLRNGGRYRVCRACNRETQERHRRKKGALPRYPEQDSHIKEASNAKP